MRKAMFVLVILALLALGAFYTAAAPEDAEGRLTIEEVVVADRVITYAWDLGASLVSIDHFKKVDALEALFEVRVERQETADEVKITVEASLNREAVVEDVLVELGAMVDGAFEAFITYKNNDFEQVPGDDQTIITVTVTVDLLELVGDEPGLPEKIRLSVLEKKGKAFGLTAMDDLVIPDAETFVHGAARIETDLLAVVAGLDGAVDPGEGAWDISADELDDNNLFETEVAVTFSAADTSVVRQMVVAVDLFGDDDLLLASRRVKLAFGSGGDSWTGKPEKNVIGGDWLPPVRNGFVLDAQTVPISFWLAEAPAEDPVLCIFDAGGADGVSAENLVAVLSQGDAESHLKLRVSGRFKNKPAASYSFCVTAEGLDLEMGGSYLLAVMVGDELLAFGENKPAVMPFTRDSFPSRWEAKLNISR